MSGPRYAYTIWTPASPAVSRPTSRTELIHLSIAFVVLTFDLVIVLSGRGLVLGNGAPGLFAPIPPFYILLAAGAALTGFIAHEMSHKLVARRLGYWAEFRMWPVGLLLSLITSLYGFIFAAPGATMVAGMDPRNRVGWGKTGLAGPVSNLLFAAGFYAASLGTYRLGAAYFGPLLFLALINTLFAAFNLLPLGPLDGAKVLRWGVDRWVPAFVTAAAFFGVCYVALYSYGSPLLAW